MPRKTKRRHGGHRKFTLPVAPLAGLAAGMYEPVSNAMRGDFKAAIDWTLFNYLGFGGFRTGVLSWHPEGLWRGAMPLIVGVAAHKLAGRLGINRAIAKAGVPILRV
ncbi:MAG: hypothetical protein LUO93_09525 [Methanomicrobiales archaeon]|nr:hypothetical protein [Methanomicrobiales archaeon]